MNSLGNRMKTNYEEIFKSKLVRRMPAIIRLDGRSFRTFTKKFKKPFDQVLIAAMQNTTLKLCENIQNVKLGYCQSDEISLLLCDYDTLETAAWFDYEVQKLCSVSASMATLYFNRIFNTIAHEYIDNVNDAWNISDEEVNYADTLHVTAENGACFDARCFNIPKEEVTNYFLWRQQDASRNSVQIVGRANFTHKELNGLNNSQIQNKLFIEKGINWNNLPIPCKRGSCCIKVENEEGYHKWIIDTKIPEFKGEDRNYIEKWVNIL